VTAIKSRNPLAGFAAACRYPGQDHTDRVYRTVLVALFFAGAGRGLPLISPFKVAILG